MKYQVLLLFCLDALGCTLDSIHSCIPLLWCAFFFFFLSSTEVNPPLNRATVIAWAVQCYSNIA